MWVEHNNLTEHNQKKEEHKNRPMEQDPQPSGNREEEICRAQRDTPGFGLAFLLLRGGSLCPLQQVVWKEVSLQHLLHIRGGNFTFVLLRKLHRDLLLGVHAVHEQEHVAQCT